MSEEFVAIAKTTKTRGLRGELVADVLTDFPERFDNLGRVFAVKAGSETHELELESYFFQKGRIVLKFKNVDSIEKAEPLRDFEICIPESEAVALEEGEYFDWELEGCKVVSLTSQEIGTVEEVFRAGENVNLVVKDAERDYMIPFVKAICTEVDIENKCIKVDLPDGLLDF
ncbi:MAG: 16S rRNA processing protein RimM [Pyrinomonadaceae bacterium]|nr:16S rRNA processing protein RimM [Pyrinomonadaceae bacterium]